MTPDERQLIADLFARMRGVGLAEKDREAEALISQSVRQFPDAPYMLVQQVLVQEQALQQAEQRIQQLEEEVDRQAQPQRGSGSFLGGLLGGSRSQPQAGSVPATGRQSPGFGGDPRGGLNRPPQQPQYGGPAPMQAQGGGFMRQAMTTAAGVAGGVLLANTISNMFGGGQAHASQGGRDQAGDSVDHSSEPKYQNEADNDPGTYDTGYDGGDFGGGDMGGGMDV